MTAIIDNLQNDVNKRPEELIREADQARDAVERDLNALEQKLSPSELFDRALDFAKHNGVDFSSNLLAQVRNNPLPAVLAGVGIAWLMTSANRPPPPHRPREQGGIGDKWSSTIDSVQGAASSTKGAARSAADAASQAAHRVADTASHAASRMTGTASRVADSTSRAAHRLADTARSTADGVANASHGLSEQYSYWSREQPLVLGVIAIAAGAAIGAMLPATRSEDEWLGQASDETKQRVRRQAERKAGEMKSVAQGAAKEGMQAAEEHLTRREAAAPRTSSSTPSTQEGERSSNALN